MSASLSVDGSLIGMRNSGVWCGILLGYNLALVVTISRRSTQPVEVHDKSAFLKGPPTMLVKQEVKSFCQRPFTSWTEEICCERFGVCVTAPDDAKGFKQVTIDVCS